MAWFQKRPVPEPVTSFQERVDFNDRVVKVLEDIGALCVPKASIEPIWQVLYRNSLSEALVKGLLVNQKDAVRLAPSVKSQLSEDEHMAAHIGEAFKAIDPALPMPALFIAMERSLGETLILAISLALGVTHGTGALVAIYFAKELMGLK